MNRIAVFVGSFDPITRGHEEIVMRALPLFDQIIVAIGINTGKQCLFPIDKRLEFVKTTFANSSKIIVKTYDGLTIDFCKENNAKFILRGLRNAIDFEYEKNIAITNNDLSPDIETIFMISAPEYSHINASIIRELIKMETDVSKYLPQNIKF